MVDARDSAAIAVWPVCTVNACWRTHATSATAAATAARAVADTIAARTAIAAVATCRTLTVGGEPAVAALPATSTVTGCAMVASYLALPWRTALPASPAMTGLPSSTRWARRVGVALIGTVTAPATASALTTGAAVPCHVAVSAIAARAAEAAIASVSTIGVIGDISPHEVPTTLPSVSTRSTSPADTTAATITAVAVHGASDAIDFKPASAAVAPGATVTRRGENVDSVRARTAVAAIAAPTGDPVNPISSADTTEALPARAPCTGVTSVAAVLTRVAIWVRLRRADHDSAASVGEAVGTVCALTADTSVSSVTAYSARSLIA